VGAGKRDDVRRRVGSGFVQGADRRRGIAPGQLDGRARESDALRRPGRERRRTIPKCREGGAPAALREVQVGARHQHFGTRDRVVLRVGTLGVEVEVMEGVPEIAAFEGDGGQGEVPDPGPPGRRDGTVAGGREGQPSVFLGLVELTAEGFQQGQLPETEVPYAIGRIRAAVRRRGERGAGGAEPSGEQQPAGQSVPPQRLDLRVLRTPPPRNAPGEIQGPVRLPDGIASAVAVAIAG
jgi:hypothetical protein